MGEPSIGGQIRHARMRLAVRLGRRVSQADLAEMIGRSRGAVNSWERGRRIPDEYDRAALEKVLGELRAPAFEDVPLDDGPDEAQFYEALDRLRENPWSRKLGLDLDEWQRSFEQMKRRAAGDRVAYRAS